MHLYYSMITAGIDCKEDRHPQVVMRELGITYQYAVPQSMFDSWEFWNCENVPDKLPKFLEARDWDPMANIGWGLSQEEAEDIRDYDNR